MQQNQPVPTKEPTLLDYWDVIKRRKILIISIVIIAVVSSVIMALLMPKIYAATVTIMPPQTDTTQMSLAARIGGQLGGLIGDVSGSPTDLWVGILKSRAIIDSVIERFDLVKVYEAESKEETRKTVKDNLKINISRKEGKLLSITVEDKSPQRAADMANHFAAELDKFTRKSTINSAGKTRKFLEERLDNSRRDLAEAEEGLKEFQQKYKAIKLDAQSSMIIEAIGELKGELMAKEIELKTLLTYTSSQQPQVERFKAHIRELKKKIEELEKGDISLKEVKTILPGQAKKGNRRKKSPREEYDIMIPTSQIPEIALNYGRLLRRVKIQETVYELLTQQYEMAKIQEARNTSVVQILDKAIRPEKRIKPNRRKIVMLSFLMALFTSIFLAFFLEYLERIGKERR